MGKEDGVLMGSPIENLEKKVEELKVAAAEVKALTSEARSVLKELRQEERSIKAMRDQIEYLTTQGVEQMVDGVIAVQVEAGLKKYADQIGDYTKSAHDSVIREFTKLFNLLITGNEKGAGAKLTDLIDNSGMAKILGVNGFGDRK